MMNQMALAQSSLRPAKRRAEVHPVVQNLVSGEPGQHSRVKEQPSSRANADSEYKRQSRRNPGADRKNRGGITMMSPMDRVDDPG